MPDSPPPPARSRTDRRRAETRRALIGAAREILAEAGDSSASIQAITERADVGFGSFYNHFSTKAELFDAAVSDALDEYGQTIDALVEGIEDPAELFSAGVRLSAALSRSHPEMMSVLRRRGLEQIHADRGLAPRALRDLAHGHACGRFAPADPLIVLTVVGGALIALLELHVSRPDLDQDEAASETAELMLRMLGIPAAEAHRVARAPLPRLPG